MPASTSSNSSVATPSASAEQRLEREHDARQLAARGDLRQRPRGLAGIGREQELELLGAVGRGRIERLERDGELRLREAERRQFAGQRGLEPLRRRAASAAERLRRGVQCGTGFAFLRGEARALALGVLDAREPRGQLVAVGDQLGQRAVVAPEQALEQRVPRLGRLGLRRIERLGIERRLDGAQRLGEREPRGGQLLGERGQRGIDLRRLAQRALGLGRRRAARPPSQRVARAGERLRQPPGVAQARELRGQLLVLARAQVGALELLVGERPGVGLGGGARGLFGKRRTRVGRGAPGRESTRAFEALVTQVGPAVEHVALAVGMEQVLVLVLAVDLEQRRSQLARARRP